MLHTTGTSVLPGHAPSPRLWELTELGAPWQHTNTGLQPTADERLKPSILQLQENGTATDPMIWEAEASPVESSDESIVWHQCLFLSVGGSGLQY